METTALPELTAAAPLRAPDDHGSSIEVVDARAAWPGWVALVAVVAAVGSVLASAVLIVAGGVAGVDAPLGRLLLGEAGLYGGLLLTCWVASRRLGTGRFRTDFGLVWERGDVVRGLLTSLVARAAAGAAAALLLLLSSDLAGTNTGFIEDVRHDPALVAVVLVSALVAAPVVEELFFRGLLQRSLQSVVGAPLAIVAQAVLFGLAHAGVSLGSGNVTVVAATAVAGIVFGVSAHRRRRLGTAITAHAWFNVLPVTLLLAL